MELKLRKNAVYNKSEKHKAGQEIIQMGVNQDAISHIISRLTDLYADPIAATVREVISNAIDTTRRLKEEDRKEIKVTMPTRFKQEFIVEDNGEGMSKDTMSEIYAQYGGSTKRNDLTQIGAFGLGAKAPLSYCSSFFVTSIKDGMLTEVILSSEKTGNFARFTRHEKTELPNGTKVSIPVNKDDVTRFSDVVQSYFSFSFGVKINIVGSYQEKESTLKQIGKVVVGENGETVNVYAEEIMDTDMLTMLYSESIKIGYVMSGWEYQKGNIYIDLIPGLVDFSSSRDEITNNDRLKSVTEFFENNVYNLLTNAVQEFINNDSLPEKTVYKFIASKGVRSGKEHKLFSKLNTKSGESFIDSLNTDTNVMVRHLFNRAKSHYLNKVNFEALYYHDDNRPIYLDITVKDLRLKIEEKTGLIDAKNLLAPSDSDDRTLVMVCELEDEDIRKTITHSKKVVELYGDLFMYGTPKKKEEIQKELKDILEKTAFKKIVYITLNEMRELSAESRAKNDNPLKDIKFYERKDNRNGLSTVASLSDCDFIFIENPNSYGSVADKLSVHIEESNLSYDKESNIKFATISSNKLFLDNYEKFIDSGAPLVYKREHDLSYIRSEVVKEEILKNGTLLDDFKNEHKIKLKLDDKELIFDLLVSIMKTWKQDTYHLRTIEDNNYVLLNKYKEERTSSHRLVKVQAYKDNLEIHPDEKIKELDELEKFITRNKEFRYTGYQSWSGKQLRNNIIWKIFDKFVEDLADKVRAIETKYGFSIDSK